MEEERGKKVKEINRESGKGEGREEGREERGDCREVIEEGRGEEGGRGE